MRFILAFIIPLIITGCAIPKIVDLKSTFNQDLTSKLLEKGSNTIKGSALIRQQGGGVVTCAGIPVGLIPDTEYSRERMLAIYNSDIRGYYPAFGSATVKFNNTDSGYITYQRKTVCDAQGFFKFDGISDGSFFIVTQIVWGSDTYVKQGGWIMQRVTVSNGDSKDIVISP